VASLKSPKSVAHNLPHHFASTLNWWGDDYAIHHLARAVHALPEKRVEIDVLRQTSAPEPIVVVRFHPPNRSSTILESDGVRGQDCEASASERRPEGLIGVAHLASHLALAEVELPIVSVKDNHSAERVAIPRREQESRDEVAFESQVFDPFSVESVGLHDVASFEPHRNRVRKPQALSKRRGEVGHHPQW